MDTTKSHGSESDLPPCLTFDARILENNAGYSTNQVTKTISSSGAHYTTNMGLVLGSANGYFKIEYWVVHTTIYD